MRKTENNDAGQGHPDGELTDQVYEETERLLPAVVAAGYVRISGGKWAYTTADVERVEQPERDG